MTKTKKHDNLRFYHKILIVLWMLAVPFLLLGIIMESSSVQTYLARYATNWLEEKLNTKVEIYSVSISIFKGVNLKKVFLEAQNHDTLLYIGSLQVVPKGLKFSAEKIELEKVNIQKLVFNLEQRQDSTLNLQFLIDAFASSEVDTTTSNAKFILKIKDFSLSGASFIYKSAKIDSLPFGINFSDLEISNLNFNAKNILLINDSISAQINRISLLEKSGFLLDSLHTFHTTVSGSGVYSDSLLLKTNRSRLVCDSLNLIYPTWGSFADFVTQVNMQVSLNDTSYFGLTDLSFFAPDLSMLNQNISLSGAVSGTVDNLVTNKLSVSYANNTQLILNANVKGLPDIDYLHFDFNVLKFTTSQTDIVGLKFKTDSATLTVPLPEALKGVGDINYTGHTFGSTYNFVSNGTLKSKLGKITTSVRAKKDSLNNFNITGLLEAEHLEIGKIIGNEKEFGDLTFTQNINFSYLNNDKIKLNTKGTVNTIMLKKFQYKNIKLRVSMYDMNFDSIRLAIDMPEIKMGFRGNVNLSTKIPKYKFLLDISHANLNALHLEKADTLSFLSFAISANMQGDTPDNIVGELTLTKELKYYKNSLKLNLKTFVVKSSEIQKENDLLEKEIILKSDFVDGNIKGKFKLKSLLESGKYMASSFLPVMAGENKEVFNNPMDRIKNAAVFNFQFTLKNTTTLFPIFVPDLKTPNGARIEGTYNAFSDTFGIYTKIPVLEYKNFKAIRCYLMSYSDKKTLETKVGFKKMFYNKTPYFENLELGLSIRNDSTQIVLICDNQKDSANYSAKITNTTILLKDSINGHLQIHSFFHPSQVILGDSVWEIHKSEVFVDSTAIAINNFEFSNGNQSISAFGNIADTQGDFFKVQITNFELLNLAPFLGESLKLEGKLTGHALLSHLYKTPFVITSDTVNALTVNDIHLGEWSVNSSWDSNKESLFLQSYILYAKDFNTKFKKDSIGISGYYYPEKGKIDFNTQITAFKLSLLKPYFKEYLKVKNTSELYGKFTIKGTTNQPQIKGNLDVKTAAIIVNETNTQYDIEGSLGVKITNKKIEIEPTQFNSDRRSGTAILQGVIEHNNFSDFYLKLKMKDIKNFQLLNTQPTDTSSFYGTIYADGNAELYGKPNDLNVNVSVTTRENTKIIVPMTSSTSLSESNNLITFVKHEKFVKEENYNDTLIPAIKNSEKANLYGMKINASIKATQGAELQIIMDQTTGDIMKAKGNGDLKLTINTLGDINLFGVYTITEGDYLFTMKNLISKHFNIKKGGFIKWQGDPYNADLNLTAIYTLKKASLYNLMLDEKYRNAKTKVDCQLLMSGMLAAPELNFQIKLPPINDAVNQQIKNLEKDYINKQFLSLLLLNSFQPLPGLSQEKVGGSPINTGEVVTNQLNHWLSQMSSGVDIGVNYQAGDQVTTDEFDVALSTQLWDDRVTINGNLGVGGNTTSSAGKGNTGEDGAGGNQNGNTSGLVGDVEVEVKLNPSGSFKLKAFNQSNSDVSYDKGPYTQGVGVFWRTEFNRFFRKRKKNLKDVIPEKE